MDNIFKFNIVKRYNFIINILFLCIYVVHDYRMQIYYHKNGIGIFLPLLILY